MTALGVRPARAEALDGAPHALAAARGLDPHRGLDLPRWAMDVRDVLDGAGESSSTPA